MATPKNKSKLATEKPATRDGAPKQILVIDIGGTRVKLLATGHTEPRKLSSGKRMTPVRLFESIRRLTKGWSFDAVSIGYPGLVGDNGPLSEPGYLGPGWVGFDYAAALAAPVRIINDAAMQALGSYEGGRMLFLGLGTGLGSTLISDNVIVTLELGQLAFRKDATLGQVLGRANLQRIGRKEWRNELAEIVPMLMRAFDADYAVLGGGNAKEVKLLPTGVRRGNNLAAFRGGLRLWQLADLCTLQPDGAHPLPRSNSNHSSWRLV